MKRRMLLMVWLTACAPAVLFFAPAGRLAPAAAKDLSADGAEGEEEDEEKYHGSAPLKTDPELESKMKRAEKYAEYKEYANAITVWQYVLNQSGDTLMTRDGRKYTSLSEEIERILAKLPPAGLAIYRITADGEAKAILSASDDESREEALGKIVRLFFISSLGDDAAFELAAIALDRHDFIGASFLLTKILDLHPDPSIARAEILMRLAVASGRLGDREAALAYLKEMGEAPGPRPGGEVVELVRQDIAATAEQGPVAASRDWPMRFGGPTRNRAMKALPATAMSSTLTELWGYEFSLDFSADAAGVYGGGREIYLERSSRLGEKSLGGASQSSASMTQLVSKWKSSVWRPTGQMLFAGNLAIFKTATDVTAWDAGAIGLNPEKEELPVWRSAWLNGFEFDARTQMLLQMGIGNQFPGRPATAPEVMLFGDRVHQAMSVVGDMLISVEGQRTTRHGGAAVPALRPDRQVQYGVSPRRSRRNFMAAYDLHTGKARWYRSASDEAEESNSEVGFLSAPIPYGNMLLVPVTDNGTIFVYGLSAADGSTIWKSYLCDEPVGGCDPWSPVGIAVDGREAYVACGAGVVFALDAVTGQIRFAVRYHRTGEENAAMRNSGYGYGGFMDLNGWDDDMVIPYGRALVVIATDHDRIFAIDRRTGEFLWDSPRTPLEQEASYLMGAHDGAVYVGGQNCVRRYDISSGLLKWEAELDDSFGRGMLTEDAVYVPEGSYIVKIDLATGKRLARVAVQLTSEAPVGNLFSDGERLWCISANRAFVLTNLDHRMAMLEKRIADGDATARLDRMRLLARQEKYDLAVEDLLAARKEVAAEQGEAAGAAALLAGMADIRLAERDPARALKILRGVYEQDLPLGEEQEHIAKRLESTLNTALRGIERDARLLEEAGLLHAVLEDLLAVAGRPSQRHVRMALEEAIVAAATADDVELLTAAVEGDDDAQSIAAAVALAKVAGEDALPALKSLEESDVAAVRLAGARARANFGDRDALFIFADLLAVEDAEVRARAADSLRHFTGQRFGFAAYEPEEKRAPAIEKWRAWIAANRKTAELTFPLPNTPPLIGRTLISDYNNGIVYELDSEGNETWTKQIQGVWACQGLPNGHRLLASYANSSVIEFDENGEQVWEKGGLPGNPFSVQRLENGNTLVSCNNANLVVEYNEAGDEVWKASVTAQPMDARRLSNGNTLVACAGDHRVVEVDTDGKIVWEVKEMHGAYSAQRLENGNTLVALQNGNRVVEVDPEGNEVWSKGDLGNPYDVQRLESGNTLIASSNGAFEVDAEGNIVWERRNSQQATGISRF